VIFGELAEFFCTDFTVGQMIFEETFNIDHSTRELPETWGARQAES
jgi:hypothetical protein